MEFTIEEAPAPAEVWTTYTAWDVLNFLVALPHGVVAMSQDIEGLVETSTNLAVAKSEGDVLTVLMSSRSSVASALDWIRQKIRAIAGQAGAEVDEHGGYPGWKPNLESEVLQVVKAVHTRVLGNEPACGSRPCRPGVRHHRRNDPGNGHDLLRPPDRIPPLSRRAGEGGLRGPVLRPVDCGSGRAGSLTRKNLQS